MAKRTTKAKAKTDNTKRFKVIHSFTLEEFEQIINDHLAAGWELHGPPAYGQVFFKAGLAWGKPIESHCNYTQALARPAGSGEVVDAMHSNDDDLAIVIDHRQR